MIHLLPVIPFALAFWIMVRYYRKKIADMQSSVTTMAEFIQKVLDHRKRQSKYITEGNTASQAFPKWAETAIPGDSVSIGMAMEGGDHIRVAIEVDYLTSGQFRAIVTSDQFQFGIDYWWDDAEGLLPSITNKFNELLIESINIDSLLEGTDITRPK